MKKMFAGLALFLFATGCGANYVPGEHGHYGHNHQGDSAKVHNGHAGHGHYWGHGHHWGYGHHSHCSDDIHCSVKVVPYKVTKTHKVAKWRDKQVTYDSFKWVDKQEKYTVTKYRDKEVKEQRTCTHCVRVPKQVEVTDQIVTYTHTDTYHHVDGHHGRHHGHGYHEYGAEKKDVKNVKRKITVDSWELQKVPYTVTKIIHEPYQEELTRTIKVKVPVKLTKTVKEKYWVDEKYEVTGYKEIHTTTITSHHAVGTPVKTAPKAAPAAKKKG